MYYGWLTFCANPITFSLLRFSRKISRPIRLQDSLITDISWRNWCLSSIFCMWSHSKIGSLVVDINKMHKNGLLAMNRPNLNIFGQNFQESWVLPIRGHLCQNKSKMYKIARNRCFWNILLQIHHNCAK